MMARRLLFEPRRDSESLRTPHRSRSLATQLIMAGVLARYPSCAWCSCTAGLLSAGHTGRLDRGSAPPDGGFGY